MQILHPFCGSIHQYTDQLADPHKYRPSSCPICQAKKPLATHGFYSRSVVELTFEGVIQVRRYLCRLCRRTVSLLPEFVLPYLRFNTVLIGKFLKARLLDGFTLKASAEAPAQPNMPYQRGQHWIRRFRKQAAALSAALTALTQPLSASSFVSRALSMLETLGWIRAHRFLFSQLRMHLLGWPPFLAPDGRSRPFKAL